MFVLYTDGVTEARGFDGDFFGEHRLMNLILGQSYWKAQAVADKITTRIREFTPDQDLQDDLTALILYHPSH